MKKLLFIICLLVFLPTLCFGALMETLTDNFNDNSIDTAKWSADAGVTETSQRLEIAGQWIGVGSVNTYDLTGSYASVKLVSKNDTFECLYLEKDSNNVLYYELGGGELRARKTVAGSQSVVAYTTYSAVDHLYLRIREASGTIYWDYSASGTSWTNLTSLSNPFAITVMSVAFWNANNNTNIIDDFNVLPSATAGSMQPIINNF